MTRPYRNFIVSFLVLAFLSLNLLGCGSSGGMNEEGDDPAPSPEPSYNLTGTAYNPDGAPFSGVDIYVFSPGYEEKTDSTGAFSFEASQSEHVLLASRDGYKDAYHMVDLRDGATVDLPVMLQKSAIAGVNVLATAESFLTSNPINGASATLRIPEQESGMFSIDGDGDRRDVDIVLENHDLNEPLTLPMPTPDIVDDTEIAGKQAPSALVSVQPAMLNMGTPAVLTMPNPDNLDVTRVLRFDPDSHQWKTIDDVTGTSVEITRGGVYGIFFEDRRTAPVSGTAAPGTTVLVGDETVVVGTEGTFYVNDVPVPSSGAVNVIAMAPAEEGTTVRSVSDTSLNLTPGSSASINLGAANVGSLSLRADRYTIESDNEGYCVVTATVVNTNNAPAAGTTVAFVSDGGLMVSDAAEEADSEGGDETTSSTFNPSAVEADADGTASIRLKSGPDRSNRVITVTATVGGQTSKSIPIQVVGTTVSLDNDNTSLDAEGAKKANLVITVQDANSSPIIDTEVNVTVEPEGSLMWSPSTDLRTDVSGQIELEIIGRQAVEEAVLRIESSGDVKTQSYLVYNSSEFFTIAAPTEDPSSWPTDQDLVVTVQAPQQNTVRFVTSFGQWQESGSIGQKYIDVPVDPVSNTASAVISSAEAGVATIQVFDLSNPSVSDSVQVAFSSPSDQACRISLQASATVLAPSVGSIVNSVELTAKVKNRYDQAVANVPVMFFLNGQTTTGGGERVSPAITYTDAQGFAQSTFSSGTLASDAEGVEVTAAILDSTAVDALCNQSSSINIVIGGTAGSISIGYGTVISSINTDTVYELPMSVLVSDSNGNPMPNTNVTLKLWSTRYATGYRGGSPECPVIYTGIFENEDVNRNLMCDYCTPCPATEDEKHPLNEDLNGDCELTPSSSSAGSLPSIVQTDENGVAEFSLVYLKEVASWLEDEIVATAMVYGTEARATLTFWLPILEGDKCNLPGESPFNRTDVGEISLLADPVSVVADGVSTSAITAAVKDVSGNPLIGGSVNFEIVEGPGALSAQSVLVTDGYGTVYYTAPNGRGEGSSATIQASAFNTGGEVTDRIIIHLVDAIVSEVQVTAGAERISVAGVGGISSTKISAEVFTNTAQTVPDGTSVSFVTTSGMISDVTRTSNGVATATLTSSTFAGTATVMAFVDGVSGSVQVVFDPGPANQVQVSAQTPMEAGLSYTVRADVLDAQGNAVADGTTVRFSASRGIIEPTGVTSGGTATVLYTAPTTGGTDNIIATVDGGVSGATAVTVTVPTSE